MGLRFSSGPSFFPGTTTQLYYGKGSKAGQIFHWLRLKVTVKTSKPGLIGTLRLRTVARHFVRYNWALRDGTQRGPAGYPGNGRLRCPPPSNVGALSSRVLDKNPLGLNKCETAPPPFFVITCFPCPRGWNLPCFGSLTTSRCDGPPWTPRPLSLLAAPFHVVLNTPSL